MPVPTRQSVSFAAEKRSPSSMFRNTCRTLAFRLSATAIGGLSTVILARVLTTSDMGAYSIAILSIGVVGVLCGSAWAGIAYAISKLQLSSHVVMANAFVLLIAMTPVLIGATVFVPLDPGLGITSTVRLVVCLGVVSSLAQQYFLGVFLGQSKTLAFNLGQVIPQVIFVPLLVVSVSLWRSVSQVLIVWSISQCLNTARIMLQSRSLWVLPRRGLLSKSLLQTLVRFDLQVGLSGLVTLLTFRGNSFIVTYVLGLESAAFLGVALSLAELVYHLPLSMVVSSYGRIGETSMAEAANLTASLARVSIWISISLVLVGEALAGFVPVVFGQRYSSAIMPLRLLLVGTVFYGVKDVYSAFFTNQLGQPEIITKIYLLTLPVSLVGGLVFVSRFGLIGAAAGNVLAYALVFCCMLGMFKKRTGLPVAKSVVLTSADVRMIVQAVRNALLIRADIV